MIDEGIGQPWPDAVLTAVSPFKQGDLIEKPPIFYAAVTAYAIHSQTKALGVLSTDVDIAVLNPGDTPPFGLITTQTCDLCEETRKPKQPWIHIVPVYAVDVAALNPGQ